MTGWHQVATCAIAVVVAALNLAPIELQRRIVNEVVETQNVPLLVQFALAYLAVILLHQIVKFGLRMYQVWLTESTNRYTRDHLLRLYGSHVEEDSDGEGRVVSIIGSEVEKLGGFVGEAISQACANIALLLGVLIYMFLVEPTIALFALAFMVPQILVTPLMQRKLNDLVEERVKYVRTLGDRVSTMDEAVAEEGPKILERIYNNRIRFNLLKFALKSALNLTNALGPLSVLFYGGYLVMIGETQVGVIVAFISGFERISGPVRELVSFYRVTEQARVQHDMVARWMGKVIKD
ncbi:MAG: ABC transporter ATP-binding protein [Sulfitobacter sp.]|nr:ABC transporter ATP-binding protein [Sulfitobacter sp.]